MIDTENLTRKFGDLTAVEGLSLHVNEGEVFGFLGPNGAGKTTTVRMLCCLIGATSGSARINGLSIKEAADQPKIRRMIGFLPEEAGLYNNLSAYRNLDFYGRMYKCPETERKERIERFLRMLGLWEKRDLPAGTFSKGMKQKLAICRAMIHDPEILFLDEPTASLDPEASKTVRDFILELKKEKKTIFLNTHHLDEAERICDRVGVLRTKLLAMGTPEELREALWGRKSMFKLEAVNDSIIETLRRLGVKKIDRDGNTLSIDVSDPMKDNPDIVEAIVRAGGRVQSVSEVVPALEDVYLRLLRG